MTVKTRYSNSSDTISVTLGKGSIFNARHSETELLKTEVPIIIIYQAKHSVTRNHWTAATK
jgi:hypothetical protein